MSGSTLRTGCGWSRSIAGSDTCPGLRLVSPLTVAANVRFAAKRNRPDLLERLGLRTSPARALRSSPAESASAWRSRARSRANPACCSSTSRSPHSMRRRMRRCATSSATVCKAGAAGRAGHTLLRGRQRSRSTRRGARQGHLEQWAAHPSCSTVPRAQSSPRSPARTSSPPPRRRAPTARRSRWTRRRAGQRQPRRRPVQIAIHPGAKAREPTHEHADRPRRGVRPYEAPPDQTQRFVVQTRLGDETASSLSEGSAVGLRVEPAHVRLFARTHEPPRA